MNTRTPAIALAMAICLAGTQAIAGSTQLRTGLGFATVTAEGCGPANATRVRKLRGASSARASCMIATDASDIAIQLSEATAPVTAVPTFRARTTAQVQALPDAELQRLLGKWLRSNIKDTMATIGKGWSSVAPKIQGLSAGLLSRGPYVCARYVHSGRNASVGLNARSIGLRCARLSQDKTSIEEVAIQATAFFEIRQSAPKSFAPLAEKTIKSMRYRQK